MTPNRPAPAFTCTPVCGIRRASGNLFAGQGAPPDRSSSSNSCGQLALAREFSLCYAPYVNSYKRYRRILCPHPDRLGLGQPDVRIPGLRPWNALRVENRIPGADANPYLAFAATIAAGLYGIEQELSLPVRCEGMPTSPPPSPGPTDAAGGHRRFEKSKVARETLGEQVVEHYLHMARLEQETYDRAVTCWELARNFERI